MSSPIEPIGKPRSVVCTLFEGRYGLGVGALLNSLIAVGFNGAFVAGYRGEFPRWTRQLRRHGETLYEVGGVKVQFVPVATRMQLYNYKPTFLKEVIDDARLSESDLIALFDADIVVRGKWQFFEKWCSYGIALCEDVMSPLGTTHPKRRMWQEQFPGLYGAERELDAYVNSGFIGIRVRDRHVLDVWEEVIARGYDTVQPRTQDPFDPFSAVDQDALNIAISATRRPVSIVGPEQMDFRAGGYLMSHAIEGDKPWNGGFLRRVITRRGFRLADRFFMKAMSGPIRIYGPLEAARMRVDFELARILNVVRGSSR
jgi:hypothetical protein